MTQDPHYLSVHTEKCDELKKQGVKGYLVSFFIDEYPDKGWIEGNPEELEKIGKQWMELGGNIKLYYDNDDPKKGALSRNSIYRKVEHKVINKSEEERVKEDLEKLIKKENPTFSISATLSGQI